MYEKKEGFTLIELLAVIVILAIVTLITISIFTNLFKNIRKKAFINSVNGLLESSKIYYSKEAKNVDFKGQVFSFGNNEYIEGLNLKEKKPTNGKITIMQNGNIELQVTNGEFCATKNINSNNDIIITDGDMCVENAEKPKIALTAVNIKTDSITLVAQCSYDSGKDINVVDYLFSKDNGKTWNSKAVTVTVYLDKVKPSCGTWSGENTTWKSSDVTVKIGCTDTLSGCTSTSYSAPTVSTNTKTKSTSITIADVAGNQTTCTKTADYYVAKKLEITYKSYSSLDAKWIEKTSETNSLKNGKDIWSGLIGQSRGLNLLQARANFDGVTTNGIAVRLHIQSDGWKSYFNNTTNTYNAWNFDAPTYTFGKLDKRIEGVSAIGIGDIKNAFDIYYQVHVQGDGSLGWARNGEVAGSSGMCKRIEAIRIIGLPKDLNPSSYLGSTASTYLNMDSTPGVKNYCESADTTVPTITFTVNGNNSTGGTYSTGSKLVAKCSINSKTTVVNHVELKDMEYTTTGTTSAQQDLLSCGQRASEALCISSNGKTVKKSIVVNITGCSSGSSGGGSSGGSNTTSCSNQNTSCTCNCGCKRCGITSALESCRTSCVYINKFRKREYK